MSNDKTMLYITKLQELKLLDHKAKTPAFIFVFLRILDIIQPRSLPLWGGFR